MLASGTRSGSALTPWHNIMVQAKDEVVLTCRPKNENARFFDKADKDSKSTKIVGMGQELIVTDHIGGFFEGVAMSPKGFPVTTHAFVLPSQWDCRTNGQWYDDCLKYATNDNDRAACETR